MKSPLKFNFTLPAIALAAGIYFAGPPAMANCPPPTGPAYSAKQRDPNCEGLIDFLLRKWQQHCAACKTGKAHEHGRHL